MILQQIITASESRAALLPDTFNPSYHIPLSLKSAITEIKDRNAVIAELKFASPSRGIIRRTTEPVPVARNLMAGGCCALSVLTEPLFFGGSLNNITMIRDEVQIPILRKDFVVDLKQIKESRSIGADAVLLIAAVLGDQLDEFVDSAYKAGLEPLVEVHTRSEMKRALDTRADLIGVNNRDLKTLQINLTTTASLAPIIREAGRTVISESGMIWPCDIRSLRRYADGFLIGSGIMSAKDPQRRVEGFVYA